MKATEAKKLSELNCEDSIEKLLLEIEAEAKKGKFELWVYSELNYKQRKAFNELGYKIKNMNGGGMDAYHIISW